MFKQMLLFNLLMCVKQSIFNCSLLCNKQFLNMTPYKMLLSNLYTHYHLLMITNNYIVFKIITIRINLHQFCNMPMKKFSVTYKWEFKHFRMQYKVENRQKHLDSSKFNYFVKILQLLHFRLLFNAIRIINNIFKCSTLNYYNQH